MRVNLQYGIFVESKITGDTHTRKTETLCVEDGNRVHFLSGLLHDKSEEEIGKLLSQAKIRIVLFQEDSGFKTIRVINLLKTINGASIDPFPHDPKLKGHILIQNIKEAAIDHVKTLCFD
mgnify:CR=1 FL=1